MKGLVCACVGSQRKGRGLEIFDGEEGGKVGFTLGGEGKGRNGKGGMESERGEGRGSEALHVSMRLAVSCDEDLATPSLPSSTPSPSDLL